MKFTYFTQILLISFSIASPTKVWALEASTTDTKNLGRLFTQPAERQALDDLRKNKRLRNPKPITHTTITESERALTPPKPITMQGFVKRSDGGKSTVWINHQPFQENTQLDDVNIGRLTQVRETIQSKKATKNVDRLEISIPATGKHVQLKAGQKYEPETNRIKEVTTVAKEKQVLLESADNDGELTNNE